MDYGQSRLLSQPDLYFLLSVDIYTSYESNYGYFCDNKTLLNVLEPINWHSKLEARVRFSITILHSLA